MPASGTGLEGKVALEVVKIGVQRGWFRSATDLFRKKHRVLVLGATGAGKSNFLHSLGDARVMPISHRDRTEFTTKHTIEINGSLFVFVDTPGQAGHESRRMQAVREAPKFRTTGVINVVSYGYHEYSRGKQGVVGLEGAVDESFLEQRRNEEIESLQEWLPVLGSIHAVDWMITLVSKADLWWHQRDQVLDYYTRGPYAAALRRIPGFSPSVIEYCSVIHRFYGEGALAGNFDDMDKAELRTRLLKSLSDAIGKGDRRA